MQNALLYQSHNLYFKDSDILKLRLFCIEVDTILPIVDEDGYNHWQELLKFLHECCNSQDQNLRECSLRILL